MKRIALLTLLFLLSIGNFAFAEAQYDYDFQQDRMLLAEDGIYIISSFDSKDGITAYSYNGIRLWEVPFHAKITSWRLAGNYIFIFSKHRAGTKTYLTCLDRHTGYILWERP